VQCPRRSGGQLIGAPRRLRVWTRAQPVVVHQ
jgi:hypothetical protein